MSPSFHYGSGSDQNFQESDYTVTPSKINEDYLTYDSENDKNRFPLVILMQTNCDHSEPFTPQPKSVVTAVCVCVCVCV